jgi:hypothetical protein
VSWAALSFLGVLAAGAAVIRWLSAAMSGGPVLYGEGAVAHAGLLVASGVDPYIAETPGTFVAANYPPLAFVVVALGAGLGPFAGLRAASIIATLAVAALVAWRARATPLVAAALSASFVALFPVQQWGPAHKPDPLAVALTATSVLLAGPSWPRAAASGVAGALALFAKPTAALPLAFVLVYLLWRERGPGLRLAAALAASVFALGLLTSAAFDPRGMFEHVVARNALRFDASNAVAVLAVGVLTCGAFVFTALGVADGRMRAYVLGAAALTLLAAREGATVNYLLDLAAASCLAVGGILRVDRASTPLLLAAQVVLGLYVLGSGVLGGTGAWSDPRRALLLEDLARTAPHLVEDSGLLIANGIEPEVDDLFLWSRLVAAGAIDDEVTPRVRNGSFATVIADVRLEDIESAPAFERQRWPDALVREVLAVYRLETALPGQYRYVPRRGIAER